MSTTKRKRDTEEVYSNKMRSRPTMEARIDPTYGQRSALPGLDSENEDDDLNYDQDMDAISYLKSVRREEALGIPNLLVAPKETPNEPVYSRSIHESVGGFYEDGAYYTADLGPDLTDEEEKQNPQLAYFDSIITRYQNLRTQLQQTPPTEAVEKLDSDHPIHVGKLNVALARWWRWRMKTVDPLPAQVASMDRETVLKLLSLLTQGSALARGVEVEMGVSRWLWALLAKAPDRGELASEEIGIIRELGKKAVLIGVGLQKRNDWEEGINEVEAEYNEDNTEEYLDGDEDAEIAEEIVDEQLDIKAADEPSSFPSQSPSNGVDTSTVNGEEPKEALSGAAQAPEDMEVAKIRILNRLRGNQSNEMEEKEKDTVKHHLTLYKPPSSSPKQNLTTAMAHQHQAKRPYNGSQSQITNYFSPSTSTTPPPYPRCGHIAPPPLPAAVQSNLLSVGMRVRKSVPEGYKTGSYSAFTLFADSSAPSSFSSTSNTDMPQERKIGRSRARELTPFCGILKVGGMGVQDLPEEEDDVPSLSQGSTDSEVSVQSLGNKRRFEEEAEDGDGRSVFRLGNGWSEDRVFAVPRRKKEKVGVVMGQENMNIIEGNDFEDAEFLDYKLIEEVDNDYIPSLLAYEIWHIDLHLQMCTTFIYPLLFATIDGVLLRSSQPIAGASETLSFLHTNHVPFILLTNGGGSHESARVLELSKKLGVPLSEENFVQSHTPFKQLVDGSETSEGLKDKTILVTGGEGDKCRAVAEMYGFKNVVTPGDILVSQPQIWPFNQIFTDYYTSTSRLLPSPLKIDAIFVFNDPRDWALDTQIILDLLFSKAGVLGTYSEKNGDTKLPNNGWQQDNQPKLYFSNPDLLWATNYHLPRLGQGGYQAALKGVWEATTSGAELQSTVIGKPSQETYQYAERVLNTHRTKILNGRGKGALKRVFMIGDNPESDIRGANEYKSRTGTEWWSVLVKTGVYRHGTPKYAPKATAGDVKEAVKWALKKEGWDWE
ncbi:hypothetical protein B7494_g3104 [Chlorociboria aeruginascens]|nr:hypothetical protein B7494_g3104 [Chlorociboria aeruginascens]